MGRFHNRYHDVYGVAPQLGELRFDVDPTVEREIVDAPLARLHVLAVVQLAAAKRELPPDQVLVPWLFPHDSDLSEVIDVARIDRVGDGGRTQLLANAVLEQHSGERVAAVLEGRL